MDILNNVNLADVIVGYVDNDTEEFSILMAELSQFEIRLRTSTETSEGERWVKENMVHILICDWKMPVHGDQFLLKIRNFDKQIPLLLYSGHGGLKNHILQELGENNIEKLHKLDLPALPMIIEELVSEFKNANKIRFGKIKNSSFKKPQSEDNKRFSGHSFYDKEEDVDLNEEKYDLHKELIKKHCNYIISDFNRILEEGGGDVILSFSEDLNINIIDAIKSLENLDENGLKIFDFWITGYLELMKE